MFTDTLSLVEQRDLPVLTEPRVSVRDRMLAMAALIDVPVDADPARSGALPEGCWWLPQAHLALYGTACRRPMMFEEVRAIGAVTGLDGLVVRADGNPEALHPTTFDIFINGEWRCRHLLWMGMERGSGWLIPDTPIDAFVRLTQWGLDVSSRPPFAGTAGRNEGLQRADSYLSIIRRGR